MELKIVGLSLFYATMALHSMQQPAPHYGQPYCPYQQQQFYPQVPMQYGQYVAQQPYAPQYGQYSYQYPQQQYYQVPQQQYCPPIPAAQYPVIEQSQTNIEQQKRAIEEYEALARQRSQEAQDKALARSFASMHEAKRIAEFEQLAATQAAEKAQTGAAAQPTLPHSLALEILNRWNLNASNLTPGSTYMLIYPNRVFSIDAAQLESITTINDILSIAGFVRAVGNFIIIELKQASKTTQMQCGPAAIANARILSESHNLDRLLSTLQNMPLFKQYINEVDDDVYKTLISSLGYSPQAAAAEVTKFRYTYGFERDMLLGSAKSKNLFVGADDRHNYRLFPTQRASDMYLEPSFSKQNFTLPSTGILNTTTNFKRPLDQGGTAHFIALRFEQLPGDKIGIIFVDSAGYKRDGPQDQEGFQPISGIKNKIDDYVPMFNDWSLAIKNYVIQ